MNLKKLDSLLSVLAILLTPFIFLLKFFFKQKFDSLIIRPGGMGDLILLCHCLNKKSIPLNNYIWLIEKRSELWAKHLNLEYFCYDKKSVSTFLKLFGSFKNVYNSEQRYGLAQIYAYACCKRDGKIHSFSTNKLKIYADNITEYNTLNTHEVYEFSKLMGFEIKPKDLTTKQSTISKESQYNVFWVSGLNEPSRSLTVEKLSEFILNQHKQKDLYIVCAPDDINFAKKLSKRLDALNIKHEIFQESFDAYISKVKNCHTFLCVDSGPVHIASFYSIPVFALFTSGIIQKWEPLTIGSRIFSRKLSCSPCTRFGCVPRCNYEYKCKELDTLKQTKVV